MIASVLAIYSFVASGNQSELHWVTTPKGRLVVLLAALLIAFWPQLAGAVKAEWIKVRPPSKRTLKRETSALVQELFAWERGHPASERTSRSMSAHFERSRATKAAPNEEERNRIWWASLDKERQEEEQELAPLRERISGQAIHLIQEYERLGLLSKTGDMDQSSSFLSWLVETGQIVGLATRFDALSRKL